MAEEEQKSTAGSMDFKKYGDPELDDLVTKGIKSYALQNYEDAVDQFAEACQKQSVKSGQDDADLLLIYGKALFKVAVSQSEVLGGSSSGGEKLEKAAEDTAASEPAESSEKPAEKKEDTEKQEQEEGGEKEENDQEESKKQEEESDFEVAWEVLDLVRTLFTEQLDQEDADKPVIQKKLADVYDLLGEVSLESENFPQAVEDLKEALKIKDEVYKFTDSIISEAHFKLALAYEFNYESQDKKQKAIEHMETAIKSVKESGKDDPELIKDLETRLEDLKADDEPEEKSDVVQGILGGSSSSSVKDQLMGMIGQANDISSLVRKKPTDGEETEPSSSAPPAKKQKEDR